MNIDKTINIQSLERSLENFWDIAKAKVKIIEREYDDSQGSPVFTVNGKYSTKGWTEWTQGFQYGIPLLIFEACGDEDILKIGKQNTLGKMSHHLSHFGVHDHGFNNISTYGNLLRLGNLGKYECTNAELDLFRLALKISGAVQAKRWTKISETEGFIYSFNGPHSLFIDTIRTCRVLLASHKLGHRMLDENDEEINLLRRAITHGLITAKYGVYYGEGRDQYDKNGRVAHESIFNTNNGKYRCPNSQQGFSGFTTWTRGLSWAMLGFTELLEYIICHEPNLPDFSEVKQVFLKAAKASCDFYIANTSADGIPYWDTGAPNLHCLGDYTAYDADPFNSFEPVDSSAAAIGAQGLLRLANLLKEEDPILAENYFQAGLTTLKTLLSDSYLSSDSNHQGILLHSVYHYPNNWDYIPAGSKIPNGESSMWGDYHLTEACLLADSISKGDYYTFFKGLK